MTSRDFCYWLQGYFELNGEDDHVNPSQVKCIRQHLAMVFVHEIDPSAGPPEHQKKLDDLHDAFEKHKASPHGGGNPFGPKIRC